MDQFISQFCAYIALLSSNMNNGACQAALKASYVQSGGQHIYDLGESYYNKKGEKLLKDNINDKITYSAISLYFIDDVYRKKEVKFQTKCNVFLCDTINLDLTPINQSYSLGWDWKF